MLEEVAQGIFFGNLDEDSSGTRSCDVRFPELEIGVKLKKLLKNRGAANTWASAWVLHLLG